MGQLKKDGSGNDEGPFHYPDALSEIGMRKGDSEKQKKIVNKGLNRPE